MWNEGLMQKTPRVCPRMAAWCTIHTRKQCVAVCTAAVLQLAQLWRWYAAWPSVCGKTVDQAMADPYTGCCWPSCGWPRMQSGAIAEHADAHRLVSGHSETVPIWSQPQLSFLYSQLLIQTEDSQNARWTVLKTGCRAHSGMLRSFNYKLWAQEK